MSTLEIWFWVLLTLEFYTYLGYGLLLYALVRLKRIFLGKYSPPEPTNWPKVALVVPAYNEGSWIVEKAKNCLALDYPKELLDILFITDGTSDESQSLLDGIEGVRYSHLPERRGKAAAENRAMQLIDAPVVVFCDANTLLNKESIKNLVRHYENPKVGGVSGEKRILVEEKDGTTGSGEGLYWKYESTLKKWDAELWTIVGAAGELVSFRTALVEDLEEDSILDDFMQSMRIVHKGYRFMYDSDAYAMERPSADVKEELKRKYRIAAGGWQSMVRLWRILIPLPNPVLTWQYVSHRVLRWSVSALALPFLFFINVGLVILEPRLIFGFALLFQIAFYGIAWKGWREDQKGKKSKLGYVAYYFVLMNYAVWKGFFRYWRGEQSGVWERVKRSQ